jgi:phenylalanyl-tRNA synthetase beta chain
VVSHANAGFTEVKSELDAFFMNLGLKWEIKATSHPSFIDGRVGNVIVDGISVGVVGEISPEVLGAWKLENPVAAFELNVTRILSFILL